MVTVSYRVAASVLLMAVAFSGGCDDKKPARRSQGAKPAQGTAGAASTPAAATLPVGIGISEENFKRLANDMTEPEVEAILGQPVISSAKPRSRLRKIWRGTVQENGAPLEVEVRVTFKEG